MLFRLTAVSPYAIVRQKMERSPIHIDEFGTIRFTVYTDSGLAYEFEQESDGTLLFITVRDIHGRAQYKKILNIELPENEEIVKTYKTYIEESKDDKQ